MYTFVNDFAVLIHNENRTFGEAVALAERAVVLGDQALRMKVA